LLRSRISVLFVLSLGVALLFMGVGVAKGRSHRAPVEPVKNLILLPAPSEYRASKYAPDTKKIAFGFESSGNLPMEFHFSPGNIEAEETVSVDVNRKSIGFLSPCLGQWGIETRLTAPARLLNKGTNLLEFTWKAATPQKGDWGVRNVYARRLQEETQPLDD